MQCLRPCISKTSMETPYFYVLFLFLITIWYCMQKIRKIKSQLQLHSYLLNLNYTKRWWRLPYTKLVTAVRPQFWNIWVCCDFFVAFTKKILSATNAISADHWNWSQQPQRFLQSPCNSKVLKTKLHLTILETFFEKKIKDLCHGWELIVKSKVERRHDLKY